MAPEIMEIVQKSLDRIEENLRGEIRAEELCAAAGFSLSHYYRIFEAATGMSVMRYITRRRLLHAAYAMSRGVRAIDAAMEYGFDTHAGFYKAFRREFGCAPSRYLRTHRAAQPARVNLKEAAKRMDKKEIARALSAWKLQGARMESIYYPNTGNRSKTTFCIDGRFYLKTSQRMGELPRQAKLCRVLAERNLSARIIPAQDGSDVVHSGDSDFLLLERLEGRTVDAMHMLRCPQDARAIGEGVARLHEALRACDPLLCREENLFETLRGWALPRVREAMRLDGGWADAYLARLEAVYPQLPVQIIHRDPNPDNILMDGGRVTGFVDFDLSRILPRIFDPCYAATGILCDTFTHANEQEKRMFFDAAHVIWRGYDAVSPLTDAEWRALPDMVLAIEFICVAAFAGSDQFAQLFEVNRRMLRMLLDNEEKLRL